MRTFDSKLKAAEEKHMTNELRKLGLVEGISQITKKIGLKPSAKKRYLRDNGELDRVVERLNRPKSMSNLKHKGRIPFNRRSISPKRRRK